MVKGRPKGSSTNNALTVARLSVWAQCDNQNCQKWRRLPPGSVVDDSIPWYALIESFLMARQLTSSVVMLLGPQISVLVVGSLPLNAIGESSLTFCPSGSAT